MSWVIGLAIASWWTITALLAYANAWPSAAHEENDYGERHRTS